MDAFALLARRCLQLSELDFNVVHPAIVKHQKDDELFRLRTDSKKSTHLYDDRLVCKVRIVQVTSRKTPYAQVCTEWNFENDLMTSKSDEYTTK